jgi:DNA-binding transcriptional ArsR family regulator
VEVFEAIGDPVRREILVALAHEGTLSAGEIAGRFAISRPAVSRHLRVLRESGVVHDEVRGRRRIYRLSADGLEPLRAWLSEVTPPRSAEGVWSARFDALDTEVRRTRRDRSGAAPTGGSAQTATPPRDHDPTRDDPLETTRETA